MLPAAACPLEGAEVIITRPVGRGRALARRVQRLGGWPLPLPGLSLRSLPEATPSGLQATMDGDLAIFTSPAAVGFAARLGDLHGRARVATVGGGTARALARHGVDEVLVPSTRQDSDGLLALPALREVRDCVVTIVGAAGGRGLLQRSLRQRGAEVREWHVYRRLPARLNRRHRQALRHLRGPRYMLLSSVETVRCLRTALEGEDWQRLLAADAVVSSERLAVEARRLGFARVTVVGSPSGRAMLACAARLHASAMGAAPDRKRQPG